MRTTINLAVLNPKNSGKDDVGYIDRCRFFLLLDRYSGRRCILLCSLCKSLLLIDLSTIPNPRIVGGLPGTLFFGRMKWIRNFCEPVTRCWKLMIPHLLFEASINMQAKAFRWLAAFRVSSFVVEDTEMLGLDTMSRHFTTGADASDRLTMLSSQLLNHKDCSQ